MIAVRRLAARTSRDCREHAANGLTERRRSRTDRAWGYHTAQVLKTCWATGPMPLRDGGYRLMLRIDPIRSSIPALGSLPVWRGVNRRHTDEGEPERRYGVEE